MKTDILSLAYTCIELNKINMLMYTLNKLNNDSLINLANLSLNYNKYHIAKYIIETYSLDASYEVYKEKFEKERYSVI